MFSNLSQLLLKNSSGKVVFKFSSSDYFRKIKNHFWPPFRNRAFLNVLFADLWLYWVYSDMVQILYRNCYGKVFKNVWVQVDPIVTNGSEK